MSEINKANSTINKNELEKQVIEILNRNISPSFNQNVESSSDEVNLSDLWIALWKNKAVIILVTTIFSIVSVLYSLSLANEYKSTILLIPASSSSSGSSALSKLAGQFGGLASLAGVNLKGGQSQDKSVIGMKIIKTWGFLASFIRNNSLEVEVFAAVGWNRTSDKLIIDDELFDVKSGKWIRDFDPSEGETIEPSSWELYEEINERISIKQNKETGIISLSVEFYSPIIAKKWAEQILVEINNHIKDQERNESLLSIEYLKDQINKTNISEMQSIFYQLIEEQTKTLMLAEISQEYVFKTISPPQISEEKSNPKRALISILGFILGGMLSVGWVLIRHFIKNESSVVNLNKKEVK